VRGEEGVLEKEGRVLGSGRKSRRCETPFAYRGSKEKSSSPILMGESVAAYTCRAESGFECHRGGRN